VQEEALNETDPVYAIQISQIRRLIDTQQDELVRLQKDNPQLYAEFSRDVMNLDSAYQELKKQLDNNPNREILLEAMIGNLQLQSDLLSRQLLIIRQIKQKNNSHEKTRS
jgi:hypothetical protein